MRFPTEYTCNLLNAARHAAFGSIAAKMVLGNLAGEWPKVCLSVFASHHFLSGKTNITILYLFAYEREVEVGIC